MAVQISINTEAAGAIVKNLNSQIEQITQLMQDLNNEVNSLLDEGEWKGDAQVKFFEVYDSVRDTFTTKVPEDLTTLKTNIDTNLANLVAADATGAN